MDEQNTTSVDESKEATPEATEEKVEGNEAKPEDTSTSEESDVNTDTPPAEGEATPS